jgi:hypothetical protein
MRQGANAVDTASLEAVAGIISSEGFRKRCDEAREMFDRGVAVAKAEALQNLAPRFVPNR